jgi:hypothetical protein
MSHVGNGENDLNGMEKMSKEMQSRIKRVRYTAREIIDTLEPFHINTWTELIFKLEDALQTAKSEKNWDMIMEETKPRKKIVTAD